MYLRIDFPSGRFYGATASDPSFPEWPPHPSRLFSALVASAYRSANGMTDAKRMALEWMEALSSPYIAAPEANLIRTPQSFVPPGDFNPASSKREHPVHRLSQARQFPCAYILDAPIVYYGWDQEPDTDILGTLQEIARGVTHVGTSHSMTVMSIDTGKMPSRVNHEPNRNGSMFLRTPGKGRLKELDAIFEQRSGIRRPASECEHVMTYRRVTQHISKLTEDSKFEFLVLRIQDTMHGADTAAYLGKSLRRAVMSVLGDDAPCAVHGHSGGIHVGWIPLPDVGHKYAKGRVVGVAIALPQSINTKEQKQILSAINMVKQLRLPDGRVAQISPVDPIGQIPVALKTSTWTRPSTTWSTVTPVVIDRPPKKLKGKKLDAAMIQSIVLAGFPEPSDIEISTFSRFIGSPPAFRVPTNKPRYHTTIRFKEPVAGPIIAGRLRYFGTGLFRPLPSTKTGSGI